MNLYHLLFSFIINLHDIRRNPFKYKTNYYFLFLLPIWKYIFRCIGELNTEFRYINNEYQPIATACGYAAKKYKHAVCSWRLKGGVTNYELITWFLAFNKLFFHIIPSWAIMNLLIGTETFKAIRWIIQNNEFL